MLTGLPWLQSGERRLLNSRLQGIWKLLWIILTKPLFAYIFFLFLCKMFFFAFCIFFISMFLHAHSLCAYMCQSKTLKVAHMNGMCLWWDWVGSSLLHTQGKAGTTSGTTQSLTIAHASACPAPSHTDERTQDIWRQGAGKATRRYERMSLFSPR